MSTSKVYALPVEERDGRWRFRVFIESRVMLFGPFNTPEAATTIRQRVVERPEDWKELGGKIRTVSK